MWHLETKTLISSEKQAYTRESRNPIHKFINFNFWQAFAFQCQPISIHIQGEKRITGK